MQSGQKARTIAALARAQPGDVDRAWDALRHATDPRIHVFLATSPIHMDHKLRMNEEEVIAAVEENVARARDHTEDVEYSPEDARPRGDKGRGPRRVLHMNSDVTEQKKALKSLEESEKRGIED